MNNKYNQILNNKIQYKPKSMNGIFITILSVLYILFVNKIAEMFSLSNSENEEKINSYVMTVYFISILGLVIANVWIIEKNNGNYVLKKSLTYGGIIILFYTMLNNWDMLDDYAKLTMFGLSIACVVYYAY